MAATTVLTIASMLVFHVETTSACSCAPSTPAGQIEASDAGFVGKLVTSARNGDGDFGASATYSFDVEVWLHGDLDTATVEVDSSPDESSCGIEVRPGARAAVFVQRQGDRLIGGLCSTLGADTTLAALDRSPTPGGTAVLAVPGIFNDGAFAMLDEAGQLVGYRGTADGEFVPRITPCTDGRHAVSVGFATIDVLDLTTLDTVTTVDAGNLQQTATIDAVRCDGPDPSDIHLLIDGADREQVELRTLATITESGITFLRQLAGRGTIVGDDVWFREFLDPGEQLAAVNARGERRVLLEIERPDDSNFAGFDSVVPAPDGSRVAISHSTYLDDDSGGALALLDATTGDVIASTPAVAVAIVGWVDDDYLLTNNSLISDGNLELRDAATLGIQSSVSSWPAHNAVARGDEVWGTRSGTVYLGSMTTGDFAGTVTLPAEVTGAVIVLAEPIEIAPGTSSGSIVEPRPPQGITAAEISARVDIETAAAEQAEAHARGNPGPSIARLALGVWAIAVLAAVIAAGVRGRSRRAT